MLQGRVCSGDQFIADQQQKQAITQALGGACCEMEGAAITQVCALNKIPFLIIRAISDKADGSADVVYTEFEAEAAKRSDAIVLDMINAPEAEVQYVLYVGTNDKDSNQLEMTKGFTSVNVALLRLPSFSLARTKNPSRIFQFFSTRSRQKAVTIRNAPLYPRSKKPRPSFRIRTRAAARKKSRALLRYNPW